MDYLKRFLRRAGPYHVRRHDAGEGHEENHVPSMLGSRCGPSIKCDYQDLEAILGDGDFPTSRIVVRRDHAKSTVRAVRRANLHEERLRRFRKEARLLHKLKSENIIELYGWYEEPDAVYMALECCEGGKLFERTAEREAYSEQEAREHVRALLNGVQHIHEHGICLRNLQPQHLLLSDEENGVLKIADIKFAVNVSRSRGTSADLLSDKSPFPEFVAPEILQHKSCGTEADMWSVGVITYILIGGYIPFKGKDKAELLQRIRIGKFEFEENRWGSISPDAKALIKRMLTRKPENRITAKDALRSRWLSLSDQFLSSKSLNNSLSLLRIFNAQRRFRQVVICVVFVLYGPLSENTWGLPLHVVLCGVSYLVLASLLLTYLLGDGHMPQDVQRTRVVAESGFYVPDSGLCLERRDHATIARASSCPLQQSPNLNPIFNRVKARQMSESHPTSVHDAVRALALADLRGDNDSVSTSRDSLEYNPTMIKKEVIAVSPTGPPPGPLAGRKRWTETLSSESRVFDSKEYGVRLTVPGSRPPTPDPSGPVDLEHTVRLETCDSKTYLLCTVVHCGPEGAKFPAPLMLDFFVQYDEVEGDFSQHTSSETSKLSRVHKDDDKVLRDYEVLFRKGPGNWEIMAREKLSVIHSKTGGGETATFVRAQVDHFCCFTIGREVTKKDRYKKSHQRNKRTIVMRNACNMKLFVVMMPTTAVTDSTTSRDIAVKMSFAGHGVEGRCAGSTSTKIINLPAGCRPCSRPVLCEERTEFDLDQKEGSALLILCSISDVSVGQNVHGGRIIHASSGGTTRPVTPMSDIADDSERVLQYWESMYAYGGRDITILPSFVAGDIQAEQVIPMGGSESLANYALALEGSFARMTTPTPPDQSHEEPRQGFRATFKKTFFGHGARGAEPNS